jgi:5-methylcytosine-specific restriction endonuclease McrA
MATKRDYKREERLQGEDRKAARRARNRARYAVLKKLTAKYGATKAKQMMEGKDVDHKKPLSQGGSNSISNLRLRDDNDNRKDKKMFTGKRTTRPKGGGRK